MIDRSRARLVPLGTHGTNRGRYPPAVQRRPLEIILALGALAAGMVVLRLAVGPGGLAWPEPEVLGLRWNRASLALVCGGSLALAGVILQALLRNPLASPDLTGVASGAGFGVLAAAYAAFAMGHALPPGMYPPAAFVGALATLGVVGLIAGRPGRSDPVAMILVGVSVGLVAASGGMLFQHMMPPDPARPAVRWLIGSLDEQLPGWVTGATGAMLAAGVAATAWLGPALDGVSLSDEEAASIGVRVRALRLGMFALAGGLTANAVVLGGPIGFVGLICPHLVRSLAGPGHRTLAIGATLAGAALLVGADVLVRVIDLPHGRLPVGVVTALVGAPVLIAMLRRGVGAWGA